MNGGPSQVDTFDPKPALDEVRGQAAARRTCRPSGRPGPAFGSPFKFQKYGQSGIEVSELFAKTAECIDDICVIRSMHADVPNHEPSLMLMNCGDARQARPSVGSWVLYGLGTENQNLPGFIVMCPERLSDRRDARTGSRRSCPASTRARTSTAKHTDIEKLIENIKNRSVSSTAQRGQLDLLMQLNQRAPRAPPARGRARGADPVVRAGLPDADRGGRRLRRQPGARTRSAPCTATGPRPGRS